MQLFLTISPRLCILGRGVLYIENVQSAADFNVGQVDWGLDPHIHYEVNQYLPFPLLLKLNISTTYLSVLEI